MSHFEASVGDTKFNDFDFDDVAILTELEVWGIVLEALH